MNRICEDCKQKEAWCGVKKVGKAIRVVCFDCYYNNHKVEKTFSISGLKNTK